MKSLEILVLSIGTGVLIGLICGLPVLILWNWLMPEIFGLKSITFVQALGLSLLSSILFKSSSSSNS